MTPPESPVSTPAPTVPAQMPEAAAAEARARRLIARLMAAGFALLGMVIFAVGVCVGGWSVSQSFGTRGVEGTVVELEPRDDAYLTVVEYRVAGTAYRAKGKVAFNPPAHKVGERVRVLYTERQPSQGYIDSFTDRWLFAGVFTLIGGSFAAGGYCFLWLTRTGPSRA